MHPTSSHAPLYREQPGARGLGSLCPRGHPRTPLPCCSVCMLGQTRATTPQGAARRRPAAWHCVPWTPVPPRRAADALWALHAVGAGEWPNRQGLGSQAACRMALPGRVPPTSSRGPGRPCPCSTHFPLKGGTSSPRTALERGARATAPAPFMAGPPQPSGLLIAQAINAEFPGPSPRRPLLQAHSALCWPVLDTHPGRVPTPMPGAPRGLWMLRWGWGWGQHSIPVPTQPPKGRLRAARGSWHRACPPHTHLPSHRFPALSPRSPPGRLIPGPHRAVLGTSPLTPVRGHFRWRSGPTWGAGDPPRVAHMPGKCPPSFPIALAPESGSRSPVPGSLTSTQGAASRSCVPAVGSPGPPPRTHVHTHAHDIYLFCFRDTPGHGQGFLLTLASRVTPGELGGTT